ncbi:phage tail terminator protein [Shouchella hunanensis]|uniref:Minor capsid protein n=1 Tax=Shouchella hunanensis TaxID=766894 RepID=A0ABY7W4J0_9BACI|nr:minor capsid protein [Shouchella hunanensis]WDF02956.1 minor capsid protein [Shouchella hunanensis]
MTMDFLERLVKDALGGRRYFAEVVSGVTRDGNSIAVIATPSNDIRHYYDGTYDQGFTFQVTTKHENELTSYQTLLLISDLLKNLRDVPSDNDSYEFNGIELTTVPNIIGKDDRYYYYSAMFKADLYIKRSELHETI